MKKVSQKEFISNSGNICPKCRHENISWGGFEASHDDEVQQMGECDSCGYKFVIYYRLKGFYKLD